MAESSKATGAISRGTKVELTGVSPIRRASRGEPLDLRAQARIGLGIDHRADVGGELRRVAHRELGHRAAQHLDHALGDAPCSSSRRSAEQRWPAERKALVTTASTTCSGSAVLSTIIALMPPVSAISGTMAPSLAASARLMWRATAVEPVKHTPAVRASATSARRRSRHRRAAARSASSGTPPHAAAPRLRCATTGVCSAGLAATALPATSAAATWPAKIASGKFHGLMQTKTPRPEQAQLVVLAGRPGQGLRREALLGLVGVVAQEVDRLAHLGHAVGPASCRASPEQAAELGQARIERIGGAAQRGGAFAQRHGVPAREGGVQALHRGSMSAGGPSA